LPDRQRPRVLLVTGAYFPEISAAAVQCRAVAAAIGDRAVVSVLTTAVSRELATSELIDGVTVYRVYVDVGSRASRLLASVRLARHMLQASRRYDIIHVQGFSRKNVAVALIGRLVRKPIILSLHTAGQDEPAAVRRRGALAYWAFTSANLVLSVSPYLQMCWLEAHLPADRIRLVPNGIDSARFRPATADERRALRRELGLAADRPVVLFVGFFSRDKRPDLLFRAWSQLHGHRSQLVFVGAKGTGYYEIDDAIAVAIRREAAALGRADDVLFVEPTTAVDRYFRAADVYVLASVREAHPLALLEAMAAALPVIATRIPGATDVVIEDGVNGRLFEPDDQAALTALLDAVLADLPSARNLGIRARETVTSRYDIQQTAEAWLAAYYTVQTSS
jgi:glycosyltransferase involved in cell wall biosynthesis